LAVGEHTFAVKAADATEHRVMKMFTHGIQSA
jgi:hypothetical protein